MKVLFFSPYSGIWAHAFPESLIAESLQKAGHEVSHIGCGAELDYCIVMDNFGVKESSSLIDKKKICAGCQKKNKILKENLKLPGLNLSDYIDDKDRAWIDEIFLSIDANNYIDFCLDDIPIGKIAVFHVLIHRKKIDYVLTPDEWKSFQIDLKSVLKVYVVAHKIMKSRPPDKIFVYNSNYPLNRVFVMVAEKYGVSAYTMHAGLSHKDRYSAMVVNKHTGLEFLYDVCRSWEVVKNIPCSQKALKKVTAHFSELFSGNNIFVYSSKKQNNLSIRKYFGIGENKKIVVALLSSYDERFACELIGTMKKDPSSIFVDQADWIRSLIDYFTNKEDLVLLVRVHPREFPNRRDPLKSQHAINLAEQLSNLPNNIMVNWPTDNISLYDLAEETSVFLNAWSSTGKEMALLGLPVILYSKILPMYPFSLNEVGKNEIDYFQKIEKALDSGWSFERIRMAYRWGVLEFVRSQLEFPESYGNPFSYRGSLFRRALRKGARVIDSNLIEKLNCYNRASCLKEKSKLNALLENDLTGFYEIDSPEDNSSSKEIETQYLLEELQSLFKYMYPQDGSLKGLLYKNIQAYLYKNLEMEVS